MTVEIMKYYRIYDGVDYLYTGYNATSVEDLKEALLSLFECEIEDEEIETLQNMSAEDIAFIRGWQIEESKTKFEELEEEEEKNKELN